LGLLSLVLLCPIPCLPAGFGKIPDVGSEFPSAAVAIAAVDLGSSAAAQGSPAHDVPAGKSAALANCDDLAAAAYKLSAHSSATLAVAAVECVLLLPVAAL